MRSFKDASSILSPSWMSMARLTFPSRLELNRREGSFNAAPLANVILTTFLYVSSVQTMPPREKTGVPGDVALTHFHSSMISGSAAWMIPRTLVNVPARQSPSCLAFSSMNADADSMDSSNSRTYFSCAQPRKRTLHLTSWGSRHKIGFTRSRHGTMVEAHIGLRAPP